jgi:hypothetical protein
MRTSPRYPKEYFVVHEDKHKIDAILEKEGTLDYAEPDEIDSIKSFDRLRDAKTFAKKIRRNGYYAAVYKRCNITEYTEEDWPHFKSYEWEDEFIEDQD